MKSPNRQIAKSPNYQILIPDPERPKTKLPLPLHWLLGILVLAIFLPWWGATALQERAARVVLELYPPFARPSFDLSFRKTVPYDPLGFVGRGRRAGFWEWTPQGLVLAEKGRRFFTETPDSISGSIVTGQRRIKSVRFQDREGGREVQFDYEWSDIGEPAGALLDDPPRATDQYKGRAFLTRAGDTWQVKSLTTPDYDQTQDRLISEVQNAQKQSSELPPAGKSPPPEHR